MAKHQHLMNLSEQELYMFEKEPDEKALDYFKNYKPDYSNYSKKVKVILEKKRTSN